MSCCTGLVLRVMPVFEGKTYKLLVFDMAFEIASMFIAPMSPNASTSSMWRLIILMKHNAEPIETGERGKSAHLNANRH